MVSNFSASLLLLLSLITATFASDCEYQRKSIVVQKAPSRAEDYTKENFLIETSCIDSSTLSAGEVLLKALYISVDPYLSNVFRMQSPSTVASSLQISKVMASRSDKFKQGDIVTNSLHESTGYGEILQGHSEWSTYFIRKDVRLHRIDDIDRDIPTDYYLSSLGLTGATAYYGLLDIGNMSNGENVFVSGAAGATGSVVGQIAKNVYNGYVIGTAGSDEKVQWLTDELKFDAAINYKKYKGDVEALRDALRETFPNGIDIYFDNTGGFITEAVWPLLNRYGRVVLCGQIANYNRPAPKIDDFLLLMVMKEIRAEGFIVASMRADRWKDFYRELADWTKSGKVITKHTVVEGFENTIDAFMGLFSGTNIGKMVVKVADENEE